MRLYLAVFIDLYSRMVSETRKEKEVEVFDYLERFHNKPRKHSAIGLCSLSSSKTGKQITVKLPLMPTIEAGENHEYLDVSNAL